MRRLLLLVFLILPAIPGRAAADPVELLISDVQAFLQDNGAMDVIYSLTFMENESRSAIRKIGPFYEPLHFTRGYLKFGGKRDKVTVRSAGDGYYRVEFDSITTSRGNSYTLELHYRCNHRFADPTTGAGKQLLAVWFNPVRWVLPVRKSIIKLVLPLELPETVKRHEDISPEMVDGLGVITDRENINEHDKWAYVYTKYRGKRRLTVYTEKNNIPVEGYHLVKLYIPAGSLPKVSEGKDIEASGGAVEDWSPTSTSWARERC
jgi:hypothetical protein